jgi:hypothetical protein
MTGTRGLSRIRALSAQTEPQELQDLREHVQSVNCSNCGAAVDVTGESVCSYCRTPISTTAPGQIRKAIEEAERAEARRHQAAAWSRPHCARCCGAGEGRVQRPGRETI